MSKLKPLVTENPEGDYQWLHNMTVIKDKEVFLRGFENLDIKGDVSLVNFCRGQCKEKCDSDMPEVGPEEFGEYMDCDCIVSIFYAMAVGHAELRHRLGQYEATGLSPEEITGRTCEYSEDDDETWSCSECPTNWTFTDGGPEDNRVNYCPECGRKVVAFIPYREGAD
jgi:hypothetical protein